MKNISILFFLSSIFFLISCNNDDDSGCVGIDCLPPATTTGEGTFGCLVNDEPFVDNSGNFNCFYQFVDGEYFFNISPNFEGKKLVELDIGCRYIDFQNEQSFDLEVSTDGGGAATFFYSRRV